MINAILIMSAVAAILTLVLRLLRPLIKMRISASARAVAWCVVLAASLIPVRVTLPVTVAAPIPTVRDTVESIVNPVFASVPSITVADSVPEMAVTSVQNATSYDIGLIILLIWCVGAVAFLLWGVASYLVLTRKLQASRIRAKECDLEVLRTLTKKADLYYCAAVSTPMSLGVFRPCIYLPEREYDEMTLLTILKHERAHIRRHDVIVKWLAFLANAVHWFNPALYIMRLELARECELAADESTIKQLDMDEQIEYGNMLLDMASNKKSPIDVYVVTLVAGKYALKERIEVIMNYKSKKRPSIILSGILMISLVVAAILCGAVTQNATAASDTEIVRATVNLRVDGVQYRLGAYNFERTNFVKLRDVAFLLNDSEKQFSISFDNATRQIVITTGAEYTPLGSEMQQQAETNVRAIKNSVRVMRDGELSELYAYTIGGHNYFCLRELSALLNFNVTWDSILRTVSVNTSLDYDAGSQIPYFTRFYYFVTYEYTDIESGFTGLSGTKFDDDNELTENDILRRLRDIPFRNLRINRIIEFEKSTYMRMSEPESDDVIIVMIENIGLMMTAAEYQAYIDAGAVEENIFDFVSEESLQNYLDALNQNGSNGNTGGVPLG
jgi:beta-lactamase regulating signal transducer with metallopeptidase domain